MGTATIFRSSDGSAPVLTGAVGSLTALLNACLVVGYGAKAALGWTRPYHDAANNTSVFRQGAGPQHYLRVNDNGPGAGTAKEARAVGYEVMTDVNTGTGPFPTAVQMATGLFIRKSVTADATARSWILIGTSKVFYLFVYTGDVANRAFSVGFGSAYSIVPTDNYATFLAGRSTENSAVAAYDRLCGMSSTVTTAVTANYMARAYTGVGSSITLAKWGDYFQAAQTAAGSTGGIAYPSPIDGSLVITPINYGGAADGLYRGVLPGLWNPMHVEAFADGDTLSGIGGLSSRTFEVVMLGAGQVLIETSTTTWTEN